MPREPESPVKPLEWSPRAWGAYSATLAFIADEDPAAAQLVKDRVDRALNQIAAFPSIGTPSTRRGLRRFPVPNTGHIVLYRVRRRTVLILGWFRARQRQHRALD